MSAYFAFFHQGFLRAAFLLHVTFLLEGSPSSPECLMQVGVVAHLFPRHPYRDVHVCPGWQEDAQLWEQCPDLTWRRSLAAALCCAPRWAAGRGSQQFTSWNQWQTEHLPFSTEWSFFFCSLKKLLQINKSDATKESSIMAHGRGAPSQLWGEAAMMAQVWFQLWVDAWSPILCLTREHPFGADLPCTQALGMWARAALGVWFLHPCVLPLKLMLLFAARSLAGCSNSAWGREQALETWSWEAGLGEQSLHGQPAFQVVPIRLTQTESSQGRNRLH